MKHRLLLVDDEPDFTAILAHVLRDAGWAISTACSTGEAFEILDKEPIALILSDINMPDMKGFEFLHIISRKLPTIKRILITGYEVKDYLHLALQYNIGNILIKSIPFNFEELFLMISNLIDGDIFGLNRYIHGECCSEIVTSATSIEGLTDHILGSLAMQRKKMELRLALHEMIINALFYGVGNARGDNKKTWNWNSEVLYRDGITVSWGKDSEKAGVSVTDSKGSLTKQDILYWLERNTILEEKSDIDAVHPHGKGIYITRKLMDRLIINIDPSKRTELILLNYITEMYNDNKPLWIQEL